MVQKDPKIKTHNITQQHIKQKLANFLKDKTTAHASDFKKQSDKNTGISSGYIGTRIVDHTTFMIKPGLKYNNFDNITAQDLNRKIEEKDDFMREYIAAPLFRRYLYDKAPIIEMVTEGNLEKDVDKIPSNSEQLYVRSKFLEGFVPLWEFKLKNPDKLTQLQGLEKAIATCIFLGDGDYHDENLGVLVQETNGQKEYYIVKIDHGKSSMMFNHRELIIRQQLYTSLAMFDYDNIPFNIFKLKNALNEITKSSIEELSTLIHSRTFNLKQAGFIPNKSLGYIQDKTNLIQNKIDNYEDLEKLYVEKYTQQVQTIKSLSDTLDTITRIDMPNQWQDRQWLEDINSQDPIAWAITHNKTIEKQDAVSWAIKHDKKIEGLKPAVWVITQEKLNTSLYSKIDTNKIDDKDPVIWAYDHKLYINGIEPITWAIQNNQNINGDSPWKWAIQNLDQLTTSSLIQNHTDKLHIEDVVSISQTFNCHCQ